MSVGTVSSSTGPSNSQSQTGELMDRSIHIYEMPEKERMTVCYYLEQQNIWEVAAQEMGYGVSDMVKIKKMANDRRITPAAQLISSWGDQDHTVTELFMVLNKIKQFSAMECLKDHVEKKYHRLLSNRLPNFQMLLGNKSIVKSNIQLFEQSGKILNGPEMSRNTNESETDESSAQTSDIMDINKIEKVSSNIPQIPYQELEIATDRWNDANKLGSGGFGIVYKGRWKYTDVAIKKIVYRGSFKDEKKKIEIEMKQSINELRFLNAARHDNILPLYGYCLEEAGQCLVYQYMAGGSLESRLRAKLCSSYIPLSFEKRKNIALGTARGLQYLHTFNKKPLIHGDIKPANILLDPCGVPKIGDFGLVREGSNESMEVSSIYGTKPYLPKEFLENHTLSTKIDTYSFGIVVFELFTGLKAHDPKRGVNQAFLAKYMRLKFKENFPMIGLLDKTLNPAEVCVDTYFKLIQVGLCCIEENPQTRPEMVEVLHHMDGFIKIDDYKLLQ